jgi:phosphatidylserine decarboxylase
MDRERVLIGIFMSPFSVHYNRAPIDATVDFIRHHPAQPENLPMRSMHFRTIVGCKPLYRNSMHIVQNERTVTRFDGHWNGERVPAYVVQIGGWSVNGIDSYFGPGESVRKGEIFGMIRIGSQVDLVLPDREDMELCVEPGQKVRAGETILLRARQPEPDKRLAPENAGVTTS